MLGRNTCLQVVNSEDKNKRKLIIACTIKNESIGGGLWRIILFFGAGSLMRSGRKQSQTLCLLDECLSDSKNF